MVIILLYLWICACLVKHTKRTLHTEGHNNNLVLSLSYNLNINTYNMTCLLFYDLEREREREREREIATQIHSFDFFFFVWLLFFLLRLFLFLDLSLSFFFLSPYSAFLKKYLGGTIVTVAKLFGNNTIFLREIHRRFILIVVLNLHWHRSDFNVVSVFF